MKGERFSLLFLLLLITAISFLHTIKIMNRDSAADLKTNSKEKTGDVASGRSVTLKY